MDLKTLKLELLERIALLEDEPRLLALKRLLDSPSTYAAPGDHLSVVREGEVPYLKLEDRMYTAEEVRKLINDILHKLEKESSDPSAVLTQQEWNQLDSDHAAYLRGEGNNYSWAEVQEQLRKDRGE